MDKIVISAENESVNLKSGHKPSQKGQRPISEGIKEQKLKFIDTEKPWKSIQANRMQSSKSRTSGFSNLGERKKHLEGSLKPTLLSPYPSF